MSQIAELEADLQELLKLSETAQRKRTKDLLKNDVEQLKILIEKVAIS